MARTLGDALFVDIDNNNYLNELYGNILYNYSLLLFNNTKAKPKPINIIHAIRFADILSKSINTENSEIHKIWAQEIAALLHTLYPDDSNVQYCIGSVLTNTGNFRGLDLRAAEYESADMLDRIYTGFAKELLRIPAEPSQQFFRSQKNVYDKLNDQYFSYSGPTSMGKSFVIRMFIKKQILDGAQQNFAILIPTKALINEVSSKIIEDLKDLLAEHDYRVVTSAGALSLQQQHNFVLTLTPERLLYLLLDKPGFKIDYLFIDEAHKISSRDSRSPFYYKVIDMLSKRNHKTHMVFLSPNIPNPEIYLNLIPGARLTSESKLTSAFTPVSQMKYLVDLIENCAHSYNDRSHQLSQIGKFNRSISLSKLVFLIGGNSQNIVYCSSTAKAVSFALEYSKLLPQVQNSDLLALARDIKNEIHGDYYLAEVLSRGVAYHIGYLPSDIRMRIEDLFKHGLIKTIFCTSTLVEGVNLPADNLFITSYKNGLSNMTPVDFRNLIGRVGRIEFNLYGNVFLVRTDDKIEQERYIELLQKDVPAQRLSIVTELTKPQKRKIIESLLAGKIELLKYPKNQSADEYSLMRRFAIILLRDIVSGNNNSVVKKEFANLLSQQDEEKITALFSTRTKTDDDINVSVDQMDNLSTAIARGLKYPSFNVSGNPDYNELLAFLETLCGIYKWEVYESSTLGHKSKKSGQHGKLRWYAVILAQWIQGNGLSLIMKAAIDYKNANPSSGVEINGALVNYNDSTEHKNIVISATLNAIEDVILFRISNYFLKFSVEYKKHHKLSVIQNDWYEYVEYGTTNPLTIMLQRNGFSREASTYIKTHREYVAQINGEYVLKNSLLACQSKSIQREAKEVKYNIPELFID
ncbi:DEAD/DEAH box helicase [Lucifera butyrica]|uniref:DEAD/DEAH box helicase n=1 Tax=Lucifera butyrica TaxID=1351585 RepID=UPI001A9F2CFD|nr:DEAD/DEAH box helicase [Lucifera butyrica]